MLISVGLRKRSVLCVPFSIVTVYVQKVNAASGFSSSTFDNGMSGINVQ